jgi:hypothetical protein
VLLCLRSNHGRSLVMRLSPHRNTVTKEPSTGALPARAREARTGFLSPGHDVAEMMGAREWNHTGRLTPRQRPFLLSLITVTSCAWLAVVDGVRPSGRHKTSAVGYCGGHTKPPLRPTWAIQISVSDGRCAVPQFVVILRIIRTTTIGEPKREPFQQIVLWSTPPPPP